MNKFNIVRVGGNLYVIVQAEHLLALNTIILVPALPKDQLPALRGLTTDIDIDGQAYRIRSHMPLTVDARSIQKSAVIGRLSSDEGQKIMDGLNAILWGF